MIPRKNAESTKCSLQLSCPETRNRIGFFKTKWLPVEEHIKYNICQMAHKSITDEYFPS